MSSSLLTALSSQHPLYLAALILCARTLAPKFSSYDKSIPLRPPQVPELKGSSHDVKLYGEAARRWHWQRDCGSEGKGLVG